MPIFQYRCADCGATFEYLVRSRGETVQCRKCNSENLEKLPSAFAVASAKLPACGAAGACPAAHSCSGECCCHHGR